MNELWNSRTVALLGPEGESRLSQARVLVVGVGGVGGYVAEMLVRSGLGSITLLDSDAVAPSNINRQLVATHSAIGESKVHLFAQRFREINPACEVTPLQEFLTPDTVAPLLSRGFDFVADCIDTVASKVELLAQAYLGFDMLPWPAQPASRGVRPGLAALGLQTLADLACQHADVALRLRAPLGEAVKKEGMESMLEKMELPLLRVLARMEMAGVRIDVEALEDAAGSLRTRLDTLEKEIHALAGEEFNIGSPAKVGEILFDRLALDPKAKKTKTGQYSTSEEVLEKVAHKSPIVGKILEHRQLKKLLSTYLTALPAAIDPRTGKIHTNYNQTVTATGRISSSSPNLQNIPVRDDIGREIRRAFIADPGHLFLSADYSQIELRLVADFSGDETMTDAFAHGKDIHAITAAKIYHTSAEKVTDTQRRHAKTANFGILYGISAFGLASRLNIPRSEAKELIDSYFDTFPTIKRYMNESVEHARENGYVATKMGRKRFLPDINSKNPVVRGYAERNAVNAPIQGSAADIIKCAMVAIADEMERKGMESKMIMQVHDELNFDVVPEELPALQELVGRQMEAAYSGNVRLTASSGTGTNWLDAH